MLRVKGNTLEASCATGLARFPSSPRENGLPRHSKQGTGFRSLLCGHASDCASASTSLRQVLPPFLRQSPGDVIECPGFHDGVRRPRTTGRKL